MGDERGLLRFSEVVLHRLSGSYAGRYPSGQRGRAVNPLALAYGASNPPLPTMIPEGGINLRFEISNLKLPDCGNSSAG